MQKNAVTMDYIPLTTWENEKAREAKLKSMLRNQGCKNLTRKAESSRFLPLKVRNL